MHREGAVFVYFIEGKTEVQCILLSEGAWVSTGSPFRAVFHPSRS